MERRLKERLIGAAVLVMLAVIFIPMILDDRSDSDTTITESNIPERPDDNFNSRIVPLNESDMTPVVIDVQPIPEVEEPLLDSVTDIATPVIQEEPKSEVEKPLPEVETVKPARAGSAKPVGATAWVVQLGSFGSEENAKALNSKLRDAGYPSFVEPLKRKSGMAYRVRVGPELLRSDAQSLQEKLRKNMQIEGIVIRYP